MENVKNVNVEAAPVTEIKEPKRRGRTPGTVNKTPSKAALRLQIQTLEVRNAQLVSLLEEAQVKFPLSPMELGEYAVK